MPQLGTSTYLGVVPPCRKELNGRIRPSTERHQMKLRAFRIATTIATIAMVIAASGAGQKWGH